REAAYTDPHIDDRFDPTGPAAPCCSPPIVQDQGDLLDAIFANEPIGMGDPTSLLYVNFKAPDYTGHVYGMASERERIALAAVDAELGRLVRTLQTRFRPGEYALIVTADHGQCPPVDASGGVRLDPIQLQRDIEALHGRSDVEVVESVVPSEVYLREEGLASSGLTADAIAAALSGYRYGDNIGRYVRHDVVASDRLHHKIFAAVLPSDTIDGLAGTDLSSYGNGIFADADPNGIPPREW
ncbi:MAG: alkaline phosphatase family protein, partial [Actinomycetota bacterium]